MILSDEGGREPEFNRHNEAKNLGLTHLFEVDLSNHYQIAIDWEKIRHLPGIELLKDQKIGLTVVFTDEVLPAITMEGITTESTSKPSFFTSAGFTQIRRLHRLGGQKDLAFVISTIEPTSSHKTLLREPTKLGESLIHELAHLIHELTTEEEHDQILRGNDWRQDPEGDIEGFAKAYAQKFAPTLTTLKVESLPAPTFTEEELATARNRLYHALHWEAVRQDLLKEPKNPPHFKPGIEK